MLEPVATPAQAAEVDCYAHMDTTTAYPNVRGGTQYESHTDWRELDIHIAGIKKLSGKRLVIRAHGVLVGRIRVRTRSSALVTSGTLRTMHHNHMM